MLTVRVDRHRCVGAGNCITLAPTAFDWFKGELLKAEVVDVASVDEELLRQAALSCPTQAIVIEDVTEQLPWQLRAARPQESKRVMKTFMFTDIVKSTNLLEALGDEFWEPLLRWHDQTLRSQFLVHHGEEVVTTGDGFFVGFDSPDAALACAVDIQRSLAEHRREHGFAPQVRIGVHASGATQTGRNFSGKGVHEAARIAALAGGGEILTSLETAKATSGFKFSEPKAVTLKGIAEPMETVFVDWH
jgi:class 3 adenylate cyclase